MADGLARAGGWTLFILTITAIAVTGVRGDWVFGWIYRRGEERDQRILAVLEEMLDKIAPRRGPGG